MKRLIKFYLLLLFAVTSQHSFAADESGSSGWEYTGIPFMWAINVQGDSKIGNAPTADIDISFSEVIDNLNFGLMGRIDATNGKWNIYGSGLGAIISADKESQAVGIDVDIDTVIVEGGVQYRIGEWPIDITNVNGTSTRSISFDVLAGVRWSYQDIDIDGTIDIPGRPPLIPATTVPIDVSASENWFDPFIGAEVHVGLSENWDMVIHEDFGGFGVGSDFTSNTVFGLTRKWKEDRKIFIGYRALYQDYETGSGTDTFVWDAWMHGPMIGAYIPF